MGIKFLFCNLLKPPVQSVRRNFLSGCFPPPAILSSPLSDSRVRTGAVVRPSYSEGSGSFTHQEVETPVSHSSGQETPTQSTAAALHVLLRVQKLPRLHSSMMWSLVSCTLCLFMSSQLCLSSVWAAADELEGEVKIEVLFKPLECSPKSKKGDLLNAHYDGYLAKDGSQFYCRSVV